MKIIVAIDLGQCKPEADLLSRYDADGKMVYVKTKDLPSLAPGTKVSFDNAYLEFDPEDDSFYAAEFVGFTKEEGDG